MLNLELTRMLRWLISDLTKPYTYANNDLWELLIVAAIYVNVEVDFTVTYTIDADALTLSPDPTEAPRDEGFMTLVTLKAACILDMTAARKTAGKAFAWRDGGTSVDRRASSDNQLKLIKEGWCKQYAELRDAYILGNNEVIGAAIMTPFRIYSEGNPSERR